MRNNLTIGIDFDNTIVCYDTLFYKTALEKKLIPSDIPQKKNEVRDFLRKEGKNDLWTELQGYVYGARMDEADFFPGVKEFFCLCKEKNININIISHKTKHPVIGPDYDLHKAARHWLKIQGFFSDEKFCISEDQVFFHETIEQKINRIGEKRCGIFIDDLPEIFNHPLFPSNTEKILFNPHNYQKETGDFESIPSWDHIRERIENKGY